MLKASGFRSSSILPLESIRVVWPQRSLDISSRGAWRGIGEVEALFTDLSGNKSQAIEPSDRLQCHAPTF